jgi:hypothetical protein
VKIIFMPPENGKISLIGTLEAETRAASNVVFFHAQLIVDWYRTMSGFWGKASG